MTNGTLVGSGNWSLGSLTNGGQQHGRWYVFEQPPDGTGFETGCGIVIGKRC